jgi:zinc/manganese transport system permease protein
VVLASATVDPHLDWNLLEDVRQLFDFPFMVNAFRAGTVVALIAGVVGWFMILRKQTFAGHTLALIGFPGAAGAVLIGVSAQFGFFVFCATGALVIGLVPARPGGFSEQPAVIGTVQAFALASGFLFVSLYGGNLNGINALLFGGLLGVSDGDVLRVAVIGVVALVAMGVMGRPLLFATIDPEVAATRRVPVRGLSLAYLLLLGVTAAACTQITGALLVLALLVLPAATAQTLTMHPAAGLLLSAAFAVAITWCALAAAYYSPYPVGFWLTSVAFAVYLVARGARRVAHRARVRYA